MFRLSDWLSFLSPEIGEPSAAHHGAFRRVRRTSSLASLLLREFPVTVFAARPCPQISQTLTIVAMFRVVEESLESCARHVGAEAAMLQSFGNGTRGYTAHAPEHLTLGSKTSRAIGFRLPFTSSTVCAADSDQFFVHVMHLSFS